ncbi:MAG: hypothetical protein IBJ10_02300, partial [Phycisphaerales bacterium]|nr:hypothetical protein [Phycisphaerales bacterium]
MPLDTTSLDRLAEKLTSPNAEPLSDAERAAIVGALARLATDQAVIARQRRLLIAYGAGAAAIDAALAPSLTSLADHPRHPPGAELDPVAALTRREALAAAADAATSAREIVRAALGFARD